MTGSITGAERVLQTWILSQTGNWTAFTNDLNGDGNVTDPNERDEMRTFSDANEILSRASPSATVVHDAAGEMTNDGINYRFVYDAWGRLTKITDRTGPPGVTTVEYAYDALGERIGWHYDVDTTGTPGLNASDPWYWFIYDDRWRIVNTYRVTTGGTIDTYPKERFVHHAAGRDGRGGSSYVDSMILADRDLDTTWSAAADATAEHRYFYLQNWRADTCAITNENGVIVRSFRYSAYGTRTDISAADFNRSGAVDSRDNVCCDVLDLIQRRGEGLGLAVVELDVVARGRACLKSDGLADDESDCFGFGLQHGFAGGALISTMQKLAGEFMDDD